MSDYLNLLNNRNLSKEEMEEILEKIRSKWIAALEFEQQSKEDVERQLLVDEIVAIMYHHGKQGREVWENIKKEVEKRLGHNIA